jgi:hypothetical protein
MLAVELAKLDKPGGPSTRIWLTQAVEPFRPRALSAGAAHNSRDLRQRTICPNAQRLDAKAAVTLRMPSLCGVAKTAPPVFTILVRPLLRQGCR